MRRALLLCALWFAASPVSAPVAAPVATQTLAGIYESVPASQLPGGLKHTGDPGLVALQPGAEALMKAADLKEDAAKLCLPVGPFRMMARDHVKVELAPAPGLLVMFFEDISHGHMRNIHLGPPHPGKATPSWMGDSIGAWDGDTLVIDTTGFNDRTWLNELGAPHSPALHLVERIRPLRGGAILEYTVTADDPQMLTAPYTYVRYYRKTTEERADVFCEAILE